MARKLGESERMDRSLAGVPGSVNEMVKMRWWQGSCESYPL